MTSLPPDLPKIFTVREAATALGIPDSAGLRMLLGEWRALHLVDRLDKTLYRRRDK